MIPETRLGSWEDYKIFVSKDLFGGSGVRRGKFLFRGQGNSDWTLSTSFDRIFSHLDPSKRDEIEQLLLSNFRRECETYPEFKDIVKDDILTTALAQHFGIPTRLLDWSESPYIAAFFAFQGLLLEALKKPSSNTNVAVWILDRENSHVWSSNRGVALVEPMTWHNERLRKQYGWFTAPKIPFNCLEEYAEKLGNPGTALQKVLLPTSQVESAMNDLDLMGINSQSLFGDLDGAARHALARTILFSRNLN
jgi:FRG domain